MLLATIGVVASQSTDPKSDKQADEAKELEAKAQAAYFVLRARCWGCHGASGEKVQGKSAPVDWVLNYDDLIAHELVVPKNEEQSKVLTLTAHDAMKKGKPAPLANFELSTLQKWIKAGAPKWKAMNFDYEWVPLCDSPCLDSTLPTEPAIVEGLDGNALLFGYFGMKEGLQPFSLQAGQWKKLSWKMKSWASNDMKAALVDREHGKLYCLFSDKWASHVNIWDGKTWSLDSKTNSISELKRSNQIMTVDGDGKVRLLGGYSVKNGTQSKCNECWLLKDGACDWQQEEDIPFPREWTEQTFWQTRDGKTQVLGAGGSPFGFQVYELGDRAWKAVGDVQASRYSGEFWLPVWRSDTQELFMIPKGSATTLPKYVWKSGEWKETTYFMPVKLTYGAKAAFDGGEKAIVANDWCSPEIGISETWKLIPWRK